MKEKRKKLHTAGSSMVSVIVAFTMLMLTAGFFMSCMAYAFNILRHEKQQHLQIVTTWEDYYLKHGSDIASEDKILQFTRDDGSGFTIAGRTGTFQTTSSGNIIYHFIENEKNEAAKQVTSMKNYLAQGYKEGVFGDLANWTASVNANQVNSYIASKNSGSMILVTQAEMDQAKDAIDQYAGESEKWNLPDHLYWRVLNFTISEGVVPDYAYIATTNPSGDVSENQAYIVVIDDMIFISNQHSGNVANSVNTGVFSSTQKAVIIRALESQTGSEFPEQTELGGKFIKVTS